MKEKKFRGMAITLVAVLFAAPASSGKAKAVEFRVDATKVPKMEQWAEKNIRRPVEKWAGNVVTLLDGKDAAWTNGVVEIVLEAGEGEDDAPAWACDGKIFLNMKWAVSCPEEAPGACIHEFAHVVQDYGPRDGRADPYADTPGWLVEGIADWVRWFNYEGKAGVNRANGDAMRDPRYDGAYGLTASFLDYLARKYKRDLIVKLNKTCREGKYGESVWKELTGKGLKTLDMEWKKKLGVKVRSAKGAKSELVGDVLELVDPFVGTGGSGHTTPAAAYPFGMVQPGPDTGHEGWERCSAYQYGDDSIQRFSQNHLSGTGCSEFGDLGFMPSADDPKAALARDYEAEFDKSDEMASPGYYSVTLECGTKVEATCTKHVSIFRFTFPKGKPASLLFDPSWSFSKTKSVQVEAMKDRRVSGHVDRHGWPDHEYWFAWEISAEPTSSRVVADIEAEEGTAIKSVYEFDAARDNVVCLKVSLSRTSADGARRNIDAEVPGWDFDGVLKANRAAWRGILARVRAKGPEDKVKSLYTAVYHLCFQPNLISDVGEDDLYSTFSCWDTYRAAGPLYTILTPEYVPAFINSMLWHFDNNGFLPVWTLWGGDNQCMIGVHSVPMIVDAYLKGFGERGMGNGERVDWERAYECVRATLREDRGRCDAEYRMLDKYGYFPCDMMDEESVSRLLESCYDDACAARFAAALGGREADAKFFLDRSRAWTNCFDAATGFIRAKDSKGAWREPFKPYAIDGEGLHNYTEGNAFHWNWHVMQEPDRLVEMLGGKSAAVKRLDRLFNEDASKCPDDIPDVTGLIGQYCHGNEPSHHVIYIFSLLGRRDLTAKYVREVMDSQYYPSPTGLCGNDDCGQMSAWYIFGAMGFYPFDPCGGEYVLGAAQLDEVSLRVGGGEFRVVREGEGEKAMLNGRPVDGVVISHGDIVKGGTLAFAGGR